MCEVSARHTPKWAIKEEREHEAGNPGPSRRINGKQPPAPIIRKKRATEEETSGGEKKSRRKEELHVSWIKGSKGDDGEEAEEAGQNRRLNGKQPPGTTRREKRAPEKDICEGENKSRRKEELDVAWDEGSQGEESEEEPGMPTIVSDSDETEEDHEEDTEEDSEDDSDEESVMPKLWYKRARARCRSAMGAGEMHQGKKRKADERQELRQTDALKTEGQTCKAQKARRSKELEALKAGIKRKAEVEDEEEEKREEAH